jgi:hypothetical protein
MSWREKIKGSFEDIESFEYGGGKVQNLKDNNKIKSLRVNKENILNILKTPKTLKTPQMGSKKDPEPEPDTTRAVKMSVGQNKSIREKFPNKPPDPAGTWMPWESDGTRQAVKDRTAENCPARCKRSGKCYARAYFEGKPGRAKDCEPDGCKHIANERTDQ